jgi:hypothetical protein
MQKWHGARDTVIRNMAGAVLHQEPRMDERMRRDVGRAQNEKMA